MIIWPHPAARGTGRCSFNPGNPISSKNIKGSILTEGK
jgi:hypothetical protein